jgi:hypothetical protein
MDRKKRGLEVERTDMKRGGDASFSLVRKKLTRKKYH